MTRGVAMMIPNSMINALMASVTATDLSPPEKARKIIKTAATAVAMLTSIPVVTFSINASPLY